MPRGGMEKAFSQIYTTNTAVEGMVEGRQFHRFYTSNTTNTRYWVCRPKRLQVGFQRTIGEDPGKLR